MKNTALLFILFAAGLVTAVMGDLHFADSGDFAIDLQGVPLGGSWGVADSNDISVSLFPVNRVWADSEVFVYGPECFDKPSGDLDSDCRVGLSDLAILASEWLDCGLKECAD